ncbi:MAG: helix-turn-helix domain-containing protein [Lachnospiraceae bacterium]|nr:helix-turn-helix domain-containing protein [Lachnospiraceae bacterium]
MLGERIKSLRMARNISQVTLANQLGVTKQSVSNWENDNILPSIDMLKKIAAYFCCTTDYLLELDNDRIFIDTTGLTLDQITHIQLIVDDIKLLNPKKN